jgi:pectinesterase
MAATMDFVAADATKTPESHVNFFGATREEKPDIFVQASPISHVRPGVPPVLFIEGEKDTLKVGRAEMQEKLRMLGIETAVHTIPGAPHPFWMSEPWLSETIETATPFFKKYLGEPVKAVTSR